MTTQRYRAEHTGINGLFRVKDLVTGKSVASRATFTGAANLANKMNENQETK
jgi:hypothetical protein